jgi:hypothetical protein
MNITTKHLNKIETPRKGCLLLDATLMRSETKRKESKMEKTINELDKSINALIMDNRNLTQKLAKLKQMILINTFVDWDSSDMSPREEFKELHNLIEEVI